VRAAVLCYLRSSLAPDALRGEYKVVVDGAGVSEDGLAALIALEELLRCQNATRKHGVAIVHEVIAY
jgi:hypothetical protein